MDAIDIAETSPLVTLFLLACPFCGRYPRFVRWHGGGPEKRHIMCRNDRCAVAPSVTGETPKMAAAKWNRRKCLGIDGYHSAPKEIKERPTNGAW